MLATKSVARFLVAVKNSNGCFQRVGFVTNGKRMSYDRSVGRVFPPNTRARQEMLSACRWSLKGGPCVATWVEFESARGTVYRVIPID